MRNNTDRAIEFCSGMALVMFGVMLALAVIAVAAP